MARHIHIYLSGKTLDNTWEESKHPRKDDGKFGLGGDPAVVNLPLNKRPGGSINAQLDKYKAEQAAAAADAAKQATAQRKTDKQRAKELLAKHGEAIMQKHSAKFGAKELKSLLDQWVKWEPKKMIMFAEKFEKEQGNATA